MTSIISDLRISANDHALVQKMIELGSVAPDGTPLAEKRTIYSRGECRKLAILAAPFFGRTLTWAPAWIVKNDAARVQTTDGIARGLFDLSQFEIVEKVRKVRAPKAVEVAAAPVETLLDKVLESTVRVPDENLINAVIEAQPSEPVIEEAMSLPEAEPVVEAPKKRDRKSKK